MDNSKLKRDLIYFDIESTGLDISTSKIVELYAIKVKLNGEEETLHMYFNPIIEVEEDAYKLHNLSNDFLGKYKTFREKSDEVFSFFKDCDLAGYNIIQFDIPMLTEEFLNSSKPFNPFKVNIIDGFKIIRHFETLKLEDVYKRYFDEEIEDVHSANSDTVAVKKIIQKQMDIYNLGNVEEISNLLRSNDKGHNFLDFGGVFYESKGEYYFGKGKNKNNLVRNHIDYLNWILEKSDFPKGIKIVAKLIKSKLV